MFHKEQKGKREGREEKCKRVKERKACKIGQKLKKEEERTENKMERQAGMKDCSFLSAGLS